MIPYGQPGWFAEAVAEARKNIEQRRQEVINDTEACTLLDSLRPDLPDALRRQLHRAANYLRNRDDAVMAWLEREIHKSIIRRRARHAATCDCGAYV